METTIDLLARIKGGDSAAVSELMERSVPPLHRWARGRIPSPARHLAETQDIVEDAITRTLPQLDTFEATHPGALQAFLRQAVANHIIDLVRKAERRPAGAPYENAEDTPDPAPSPLERAIGREGIERYEAALERLKPEDREAIIARIELQQSYEEVAIALGKPTANAARAAVTLALGRLIDEMA
jgi:RNA polymerase sigma-70 factor, ECF subfamily